MWHGDKSNSKVVGKAIADINLPYGTTIGAIVRGEQIFMGHHDTVIEENDHIIIFLSDKRKIHEIELLFQGEFNFF